MTNTRPFKAAGVIGWPVSQSRSPKLHGYWLEKYKIPGAYILLPVQPEKVGDAIKGLVALGFAGCNVTIPHKLAVMPLLDNIDPLAKRMGAVNLIVVGEDGKLTGFNKDGYGWFESIKEKKPDFNVKAGPAVVMGAGGGARAITFTLADEGAPEVRLINRHKERADKLAADCGKPVRVVPWEQRMDALEGANLLVNCTNQGMIGQQPLDLPLDKLPSTAYVSDIIYNPMETPLLAAARQRGNATVNGLGMLLHQARPAFKAWFGVDPEVTPELRKIIEATL
jgi:shikimate dehydrogenase